MSSNASDRSYTRRELDRRPRPTITTPDLHQLTRMWVSAVTAAGFQLDDALSALKTLLPNDARQADRATQTEALLAIVPAARSSDVPWGLPQRRRHLIDDNRRVMEQSRMLCEIARELRLFCDDQARMSIGQRRLVIRERRRELYTTEADALSPP